MQAPTLRSIPLLVFSVATLPGHSLNVSADEAIPMQTARSAESHTQHSEPRLVRDAEERLAQTWGLEPQEWARFRELMQGPLGVYSPNLDPLTALGIEAQSNEERHHYAELQVRVESRRVEKLLAYQRAYDEAWRRLYPILRPVELPPPADAHSSRASIPPALGGRVAVFVREGCGTCDERVKQLQDAGRAFDLYMVGSRHDDARIRTWAARVGIDAAKVRQRTITLNHDDGRWLSLGGRGELPAVLRAVGGQWQRE